MNTTPLSSVRIPFWNQFDAVALSANGTGQVTLSLAVDSHFEWWKVLVSCSQDADTDFIPSNVDLLLTDISTGRQLMSAQVPQRNLAPQNGWNQFPRPVLFAPNSTLALDLTDQSGSSNTVTVTLFGYKVFNI